MTPDRKRLAAAVAAMKNVKITIHGSECLEWHFGEREIEGLQMVSWFRLLLSYLPDPLPGVMLAAHDGDEPRPRCGE